MRSNLDQRIVEMEFQNGQFEKGVHTSIKSIEALKESLDFDGAEKGLVNLERSTRHFSMDGLTGAIEAVSGKFSAMEIVGITALQRIANKAMDAGERLIKSLSVDQITSGFSKYTAQTKAVNTIMNATGKDVDYVEEKLEKLNWFTDETSYNFTDMADNIGKFTNAGVDLDTATTAMMGIALEAASAGRGINEASRAMYNFSQALGMGKVMVKDWASIENANMDTKEFKETIIGTAVALGKLKAGGKTAKGVTVTFQNFRDTLSEGWFDRDVLLESLSKYTEYTNEVYRIHQETGKTAGEIMQNLSDAGMELSARALRAGQVARTFNEAVEATKDAVSSGWMKSFKLIFGDVNESAELWTDVTNALWEVFAAGAESRNEVLKAWHDASEGGRADMLSGLYDSFEALWNIITAIKEALADIFPIDFGQKLKDFTTNVKDFGENLKKTFGIETKVVKKANKELKRAVGLGEEVNEKTLPDLASEFDGVLKKGSNGEGVKAMQKRLESLGYDLGTAGVDGIFGPRTEEALKKFQEEYGKTVDGVYSKSTHMDLMGALLGPVEEDRSSDIVEEELSPALEKIQELAKGIGSIAKILGGALKFLGDSFSYILEIVSPVTGAFADFGVTIAKCFTSLSESIDENDTFGQWLLNVKEYLEPVKQWFENFSKSLREFLGVDEDIETFDQLFEHFQSQFDKFFENHPDLKVVQSVFGWLSDAILSLFGGDGDSSLEQLDANVDKADSTISKVTDFFTNAIDQLKKIDWISIAAVATSIFGVIKIFRLMSMPAKFLKGLSEIPESISEFFGSMKKAVSRFGKDKIGDTALKIAASIALLAGSIFLIAQLDAGKAWNAVAVVAALSAVLVGLSVLVSKFGETNIFKTLGLTALAFGILMLAASLRILSGLTLESTLSGLAGVFGLLILIGLFEKAMGGTKFATGMFELGTGLLGLAEALKKLGELSLGQIGKGLLAVFGLLTSLAIFSKATNSVGVKDGFALIEIAAAVNLLVFALKGMAGIGLKGIAVGLTGILGVLLSIAVFEKALGGNSVKGGFGLIGLATGLLLLVQPLKQLGKLKTNELARGLVGISLLSAIVLAYQTIMSKGNISAKGTSGLIGMAIGLMILVQPLRQLSALNNDELNRGLKGIGLLSAIALAYQAIMSKRNISSKGTSGLFGMAIGLLLLVQPLKMLAQLSNDDLNRGLKGIGLLSAIALAYQAIVSKGNISAKGTAGLWGMAIGLLVLVQPLKVLSSLSDSELNRGLKGIGTLTAIVAAYQVIMSLVGKKMSVKASAASFVMLTSLSLSLIAFAYALTKIKDIKPSTMLSFAGSLSIALTSLVGAIALANTIGGGMAGMVTGAAAIGAAFAIITGIVLAVIAGIGGLNSITGGGVVKALDTGGEVLKAAGRALANFGSGFASVITGDIIAFSDAVSVMTAAVTGARNNTTMQDDLDTVFGWVTSISDYFSSLEPYEFTGSKLPGYETAASQLATDMSKFSTAITDFAGAVNGFNETHATIDIDTELALGMAGKVYEFSKGLTDESGKIDGQTPAKYAKSVDAVTTSISSISQSITDFTGAVQGLSGSSIASDTETAINDVLKPVTAFLESIETEYAGLAKKKSAFMVFITGYKGTVESLTGYIEDLGTSLGAFREGVSGYSDSTILEDTTTAVGVSDQLASFLANMTKDYIGIEKQQDWFNTLLIGYKGRTDSYFEYVKELSSSLTAFKEAVLGLNETTIVDDTTVALDIAGQIEDFLADVNSDGKNLGNKDSEFKKIFGDYQDKLTSFITYVGDLGKAIGAFREGVDGIANTTIYDDTTVSLDIAGQVGKFLSSVSKDYAGIQSKQTLLAVLMSGYQNQTESLITYTEQLGKSLGTLKDNIVGISETSISADTTEAIGVLGQVGGFLEQLPSLEIETKPPEWLNDLVFGENKTDTIFSVISRLSESMLQAKTDLVGLSGEGSTFTEDFAIAITALETIGSFLEAVSGMKFDNKSELEKLFTGENSQDTLFDSVITLANKMVDASTTMEGLSGGSFVDDFAAAMRALNAMATFMDRVGQIRQAGHLGGDVDFNAILFPIEHLSDTISDFSVVAASTDMTAFSSVVTTVATGLTNITTSMASFAELAGGDTLAGMITSTLTAFSGFSSDVGDALTDGIDGRDFSLAIADIMDEALQAVKDRVPKFEDVGKNCAVGLAMGLRSGTSDVVKASSMVAKAAVDTAQKVFDQHSPSKVFSQMGMYNDMGLAKGTRHYAYAVVSAYEDMSKEAIDTTESMLSGLSVLITEDMDTTPTIRPVLDMDDFAQGIHRMDGLLFDRSVDVSTSSRLARSIGSSSSGEIATKSNSLGGMKWLANTMHEDFDALAESISNMKIVMQSGALVGEIGKDMDKYLWNQMNKEMRR